MNVTSRRSNKEKIVLTLSKNPDSTIGFLSNRIPADDDGDGCEFLFFIPVIYRLFAIVFPVT